MRNMPLRATKILAVVPIFLSLLVLAGWQFRIGALKADVFGTFVAPNTALCFILCSASILMQLAASKTWQRFGVVIGVVVTAFALMTVAEYLTGTDFGIDRLFFAHRMSDWKLPLPGRFAFNSAVAFVFAGMSLIMLRRDAVWSEVFGGIVLTVFYLAVIGRVYSAAVLYSRVMSPYTALLFGILGLTLLCAASHRTFIDTALSKDAGGIVFRRMLLAIVVALPLIGAVRIQVERRGWIRPDNSTPLFVIITVSMLTILTLHTATVLNELDRRRKQAEQALIQTEKLAAAGRMAATVAHEINNPLEAVTNLLFLLKTNHGDGASGREYIAMAEQELARVAAITKRTLGFYREERRSRDLNLGEITDGVLELYQHKLASHNVEINRSYGAGSFIYAAEGEMRQIVTNLLSNAVDALPDRSARIDIKLERTSNDVIFTFADNGSGIDEAHRSRLFEPFFTTKRDVGNGLGLWVTKALVEKNSGKIEMQTSTEGSTRGTLFRLTFPAARGESQSEVEVSANQAGARGT